LQFRKSASGRKPRSAIINPTERRKEGQLNTQADKVGVYYLTGEAKPFVIYTNDARTNWQYETLADALYNWPTAVPSSLAQSNRHRARAGAALKPLYTIGFCPFSRSEREPFAVYAGGISNTNFIAQFATLAEAKAVYPNADVTESANRNAQVNVNPPADALIITFCPITRGKDKPFAVFNGYIAGDNFVAQFATLAEAKAAYPFAKPTSDANDNAQVNVKPPAPVYALTREDLITAFKKYETDKRLNPTAYADTFDEDVDDAAVILADEFIEFIKK
jgi:hypothetical protein